MNFESNQAKSSATTHGGARQNSGRKAGAATKKTRKIADQAIQEGITPLEVMLKAMREYVSQADSIGGVSETIDGRLVSRLSLLADAASIAKDAAPYMHPRLASIESVRKSEGGEQKTGVLVVPATLTMEEWERLYSEEEVASVV